MSGDEDDHIQSSTTTKVASAATIEAVSPAAETAIKSMGAAQTQWEGFVDWLATPYTIVRL